VKKGGEKVRYFECPVKGKGARGYGRKKEESNNELDLAIKKKTRSGGKEEKRDCHSVE